MSEPDIFQVPNGEPPEEWRSVAGYEGLYEVSNYGRVKSLVRNAWNACKGVRILCCATDRDGYKNVTLCLNGIPRLKRVARLVATAFIDNPDGLPVVNHLNSVRSDNRPSNLEWTTVQNNNIHGWKAGRKPLVGEQTGAALLRDDEVIAMRLLSENGWGSTALAMFFLCSTTTVRNIVRRLSWKHV